MAQAASITTNAYAAVDPGVLGTLVFDSENTSASTAITNGTYGSGTFTATASANSTYGVLKVSSTADLSNYAPNSYTTTGSPCPFTYCGPSGTGPVRIPSTASASFTDVFTLTGGTGSVWVDFTFDVDGTDSFTSDDTSVNFNSDAQGNLEVFDGSHNLVGSWGFFGGTHTFTTQPILFTYDVAQALTVSTEATVDLIDATAAGSYDASGIADFSHTIVLSDVNAFSDSGATDPAGNFLVSADSGTTYSTNASTAPEPATWIMTMGALAGLLFWRRGVRAGA